MMDEQLAQTQTIEALRRQVETSNNAAREAQALLRATQEQQQQYLRMRPPSNLPATAGGNIGNTPFVPPLSTPSTGMRTRELHSPGYYHVGSPADPGCAEQMKFMYGTAGRENIDSLRFDPPRQDPVTSQHILYYCTYYSVSLTCTVHWYNVPLTYIHCTYYTCSLFPSFRC